MAVLSDGELTPVRRSKRNADVVDVDSLERVERRVTIKNLEKPQDVDAERLKAPKSVNKLENECDFEEDEIDPDTSTIS
ncbi:unnamed protein product [Miscanthus lutarioriparius]|uniref:Uncharacterized protein n=1 Tax=Miscanthus lutarioriparius TaxID=422564 RepID=A0A811PP17_9POAL|nr:unnamed protein product [Miscanthus lutarioriparius]